jgi:hypothetical protein
MGPARHPRRSRARRSDWRQCPLPVVPGDHRNRPVSAPVSRIDDPCRGCRWTLVLGRDGNPPDGDGDLGPGHGHCDPESWRVRREPVVRCGGRYRATRLGRCRCCRSLLCRYDLLSPWHRHSLERGPGNAYFNHPDRHLPHGSDQPGPAHGRSARAGGDAQHPARRSACHAQCRPIQRGRFLGPDQGPTAIGPCLRQRPERLPNGDGRRGRRRRVWRSRLGLLGPRHPAYRCRSAHDETRTARSGSAAASHKPQWLCRRQPSA